MSLRIYLGLCQRNSYIVWCGALTLAVRCTPLNLHGLGCSLSSCRSVFKCYLSTCPRHPVSSILHTMPLGLALSLPAPLLSWPLPQQTYCELLCFYSVPPPAVGFPAVFPPCGCLLCSLLSSGSNSAWHLEDAWQTLFEQSNPIACAGLQLLVCFLPFVDIAVPWYPWRFRSRTSCRHQSPWMLRLLT